jgi:hypothetical protein
MRYVFAVTILIFLVATLAWQPDSKLAFWQDGLSDSNHSTQSTRPLVSKSPDTLSPKANNASGEAELQYPEDNSQEAFIPNPEAVASLRQARLEGDSRTPELGQHHEREKPTEDELADHDQYVEYEKRQQKRVYRAYVEASKIKTKQIQDLIDRGKAEGVSPEEIAFAEEKIRGIEEMAKELQRDYPDKLTISSICSFSFSVV